VTRHWQIHAASGDLIRVSDREAIGRKRAPLGRAQIVERPDCGWLRRANTGGAQRAQNREGDSTQARMHGPAFYRPAVPKSTPAQVKTGFVSELCHMPPETLGKQRDLRGDADTHRSCVES